MVCFADINVSQSSVAAYARCDGIFSIHLTTNLSRNLAVKIFLNRFRFDRIVALSPWPHFFAHPYVHTYTHTSLTALCPGLPGWAGTRKVKPIWILLKQETMSGSGISWAICKSARRSRQITMPAAHSSVIYSRVLFLLPNQQRQSTEGIHTYIHTYWSNVWVCVCVCSVCAVGEARTAVLCECLLRSSVCHQVQLVSGRRVRYWSYLLLQSGIHLYICTW